MLFFKKGDKTLLKNYRPISLLSQIYISCFSRVIKNHLTRRFDDFQPPEQAGFRKSYSTSTIDHIHTLRQVIQKTEEYNLPLCLAFVDYEKAFDSIATWTVLQSLQRCQNRLQVERFVDRKLDKAEDLLKKKEKKAKRWYNKFTGDEEYRATETQVFVASFFAGMALGLICGK